MEHVLSLSYGKDSLAVFGAAEKLKMPITKAIHAEVWATDTIHADLPPMVEFKQKADEIIKRRWGIEVEHICAKDKDGSKLTYEKIFYRVVEKTKHNHKRIYGFPMVKGSWCNSKLKVAALKSAQKKYKDAITYLGIACDEPIRIARQECKAVLPLVIAGWNEAYCRQWATDNDLLSPIYDTSQRGGCWFCHFQGIEQLRQLRRQYPEYWELLLKWDNDSPVTFKPNRTVREYDYRFHLEDLGLLDKGGRFKWGGINPQQTNVFDFL